MSEKASDEVVAFGMTEQQIINAADALCQQKVRNHPTTNFFETARKGRELLEKQGNYCQVKKS
jgi:hypothetical protein